MDVPDLTGLTPQTQLHIIQGYIILKIAGSLYSSIRNGGGLRRIFITFWLGENVPKPIAQDYKQELAKKKRPESDSSTPPFGGS